MAPKANWSTRLTRSIVLKDDTKLETLADARAFILGQPAHIQQRQSWQRAAELTKQIELALFLEARYLPSAQPART